MTPSPNDDTRQEALKNNLSNRDAWLRLACIILFWLILGLAQGFLGFVTIIQSGFLLITGKHNPGLLELGATLSRYIGQVAEYLAFASDHRPFPFDEWPTDPKANRRAAPASRPGPARKKTARRIRKD